MLVKAFYALVGVLDHMGECAGRQDYGRFCRC